MFKIILAIGLVLCFLCPEAASQACGYSFAKFFVTDNSGKAIRNTTFEFLKKNSNEVVIHSPKAIKWSEQEGNYFLDEGMCGGHYDIRIKIEASDYDVIERAIDLPLTNSKHPRVYRVRLKKKGSDETASFESVSDLRGTIFDGVGALVPGSRVVAKGVDGRVFSTVSNENGEYTLELPYNRYVQSAGPPEARYTITVEQTGFAKTTIEYVFVPSPFGSMQLDIALAVIVFSNPF